ncbi:hypothetical protein PMIN07_003679 [Paraphaeosphaeria minitans]
MAGGRIATARRQLKGGGGCWSTSSSPLWAGAWLGVGAAPFRPTACRTASRTSNRRPAERAAPAIATVRVGCKAHPLVARRRSVLFRPPCSSPRPRRRRLARPPATPPANAYTPGREQPTTLPPPPSTLPPTPPDRHQHASAAIELRVHSRCALGNNMAI